MNNQKKKSNNEDHIEDEMPIRIRNSPTFPYSYAYHV